MSETRGAKRPRDGENDENADAEAVVVSSCEEAGEEENELESYDEFDTDDANSDDSGDECDDTHSFATDWNESDAERANALRATHVVHVFAKGEHTVYGLLTGNDTAIGLIEDLGEPALVLLGAAPAWMKLNYPRLRARTDVRVLRPDELHRINSARTFIGHICLRDVFDPEPVGELPAE